MFYYLVFIILFILIVDQFRPKELVKLHQQLGIDWPYFPIIGQGYKFFGSNEDRYRVFVEASTMFYKKANGILSIWLGFKLIIAIADPIQAVAILKTAFDQTFFHKFACLLMGNGIVFSPADIWHRRRKILAPTFATRHVSRFVGVFEGNAKIVIRKFESHVGKGNFSCWKYICCYGLDSVCESILGVKVDSLNKPNHPFFKAFQEHLQIVANRVCNPFLYNDSLYALLPAYKRQIYTRDIIHKFVDNIIYSKKKQIITNCEKNDASGSNLQFKTFLELMIESSTENDKSYTYEELREESLALVAAGTDTSATGLAFTMLLLSQHQDVQEKVYQEIHQIFGDSNEPLSFDDLHKFKYLEAVIKETLRLYPPIPLITRDSYKEVQLPSGINVPSRCDVIIDILAIQHNPNYWGEDAEQFKPERFLSGKTQTPGAFMAFSHGARNCPGQLYAMLSIKTTLTTILRRYRLLPATSFKYDNDNPLRLSFEIMIKHVQNFDMQIEYRENLRNHESIADDLKHNDINVPTKIVRHLASY